MALPYYASHLLLAVILVLSTTVFTFIVKLYRVRQKFVELRKQGLPMPPHSLVFGHLPTVHRFMSKLPRDVHEHYLPNLIIRAMPELGPIFYLDTWPFSGPILVLASPAGASQVTQAHSLPKFHALRTYLDPLTGGPNLVTMEGQMWKTWRNIFNPGFSADHLNTLVPAIVQDTLVFCDNLREHVRKDDMFSMEEMTINLTIDVIGRVTLNTELNAQRSRNEFISGLLHQVPWLSFGIEVNPFQKYHPLRPFVQWYNNRRMNSYLSCELERRVSLSKGSRNGEESKRKRSIIDLALDKYLGRTGGDMDATFKSFAMSQIKLFVFAGHDTTSSTLDYAFHLLSTNPSAVQHLRAEHREVFGLDFKETASMITENPHLLNQLPYTVAVIKETLRLFPPASSPREGEPGFFVTDEQGRQFPTEGCLVWSVHHAVQRNPVYWPQPDSFFPERWLVPKGDPLYPIEGAWRPFELGPRHCIGQQLAMTEMKIVLALTMREFNIRPAYEEWDHLNPKAGPSTVDGERAYQIVRGGGHPSDAFPCRVCMVTGDGDTHLSSSR